MINANKNPVSTNRRDGTTILSNVKGFQAGFFMPCRYWIIAEQKYQRISTALRSLDKMKHAVDEDSVCFVNLSSHFYNRVGQEFKFEF